MSSAVHKRMSGYVQSMFEQRYGVRMADWLREHGPSMTIAAAAEEIGYLTPSGLRGWVGHNMPGFKFKPRGVMFTNDEVRQALAMRAAGVPWKRCGEHFKRDHLALRDYCRRYQRRMERQ